MGKTTMNHATACRLALALVVALAGTCVHAQPPAARDTAATLPSGVANPARRDPDLKATFDAFGGKPGLVAIMEDFMANLVADPRTRAFFVDTDQVHIKKELVDQFCVILDGPCTYTGKDMAKIHRKLGINRANFNALVEDLQRAMDKHHVPFRAQNKLLARLAPMHREVVTK
jgi:hemoglobin